MKARKGRSTKRRAAAPGPDHAALAQEHLNLASAAMLGEEDDPRSQRRPPEDASVQDPLLDWPED